MRSTFQILLLLIIWVGCSTKDESISFDPNLGLLFSNDTVAFDTLLSERRSNTQRLTVFNPNDKAIQFSEIALGLQSDSDYQIIKNGREATSLAGETLFGGDSLLILVDVNISARNENLPYIVKDSIIFRWNTNEEHVKLVSYGQDGNVIGPSNVCNETWTKDRPYIISDRVIVSAGCSLTIEKGANIFFENDAILAIEGTLKAIGDSAEHIVFRNTRFDGVFDRVPGQWDGIYFLEGSTDNEVSFAEIFNGQIGLRVGTPDNDNIPDVVVSNTEIYNMSGAGILAFTSDVDATNTLIYNCGSYLFRALAGGNYNLQHCTLSNEPALFIQEEPTVQFTDNEILANNETLVEDLFVSMINCIIWGTADEELLLSNAGGANLSLSLLSNIIRSGEEIPNNFTSQEFNFPGFVDAFGNDYRLDTLAFAKDKATDIGILDDLEGRSRDMLPDIGAYERFEQQ